MDATVTEIEEANPEEPTLRILKIATCQSLSGRSELTYHIGCDASNAIHFRLWANTAAGMFSNCWTPMKALSELLGKADKVTSASLLPEFEMTSRNNAGFTLAILVAESLLTKSGNKDRCYVIADPAPFLKLINALIESEVDLHEDDAPGEAQTEAESAYTPAGVAKRGKAKKQSQ